MAKIPSDRHTDMLLFLSKISSGKLDFSRAFGDLCHRVCPDGSESSKKELSLIFSEIFTFLPLFFKSSAASEKNPSITLVEVPDERYVKVCHKLIHFMRMHKLSSHFLVFFCRSVEKIVLSEMKEAGVYEEASVAFIFEFITGLEASLIDQLVKSEVLGYQKKLREANRYILLEKRRYYTIFSRMIEPSFIIDNQMHVVDSNRAFKKFFGLKDKSHHGRLCYEVLGPDICAACALKSMIDSQKSFSDVEVVIPVLGELKTVLFSGTFLGDINSEFSGGIISIQDITYSKKTEKALQESEEKYRTLVENVPDVTWRSDQHGKIYYVSPNVEKICGYLPDELGTDRYAKIHPEDVDRVRNDFGLFFASHLPSGGFLRNLLRQEHDRKQDELIVDGKKKFDVRYRFQKKDGSWIWIHDRATTIYRKDGDWFTDGVFSDISELKQAEDELEKHHFRMAELIDERTADLKHANIILGKEVQNRIRAQEELLDLTHRLEISNQELEQFAHIASHDIKEPLILVLAFSQRLLDKYARKLDEKGREYLDRLIRAAEQMTRLVDDLLELSRISTGNFSIERVNLKDLVDEVVLNLEERISMTKGEVGVSPLGFLHGDPVQLKQLFQNIIANALKYSHDNKRPQIEITQRKLEEGFVEISIEDNGIGFDPSQVAHIFKPFTRLHPSNKYNGTGIGLATCKKIVLRHGGDITAESTPGVGSRFIVRLPLKLEHKH